MGTPTEWISVDERLPCFVCFGFQTGRTVQFKTEDGTEHDDIYQGWGIFGKGAAFGVKGVTHWRVDASLTSDSPHKHLDTELK